MASTARMVEMPTIDMGKRAMSPAAEKDRAPGWARTRE